MSVVCLGVVNETQTSIINSETGIKARLLLQVRLRGNSAGDNRFTDAVVVLRLSLSSWLTGRSRRTQSSSVCALSCLHRRHV